MSDEGREQELRALRARVDAQDETLASLAAALNSQGQQAESQQDLLDRLADAVERAASWPTSSSDSSDPETEGEQEASGWADRAGIQDWDKLSQWVDWLTGTYDLRDQPIYSCWPQHGGVVEELAALWMAWRQAALACAGKQWGAEEALAYWHDRYLPGALARITGLYSVRDCHAGHEPVARARAPRTDRSVIAIHSTGEMPFQQREAEHAAV